MSRTIFAVLLVSLLLGGCDSLEYAVADPEPSIADAGQLITPNPMDGSLNLVPILDPDGEAEKAYGMEGNKRKWEDLLENKRIDRAFEAFYDPTAYPGDPKLRRNRIQERLLGESNRRCNVFKSLVYQVRAKTNFALGAISTVTGVVGALVTGVGASRALSGTSGIFSGLRAEFNQELFQNLASQVIVQGVDTRRREVYDLIATQGQSKKIDVYTVEAAVKDAIFYHGQCSVVVGFEMARDAIKTVDDPGISAANKTLAKLAVTRKLLDIEGITPQEAADLLAKSNSRIPYAGTPLGEAVDVVVPIQALVTAQENVTRKDESFRKFVDGLPGEFEANTARLVGDGGVLEMAKLRALGVISACEDEADPRTEAIVSANRDLEEAKTADQRLIRESVRERVLLEARALNKSIGKISDLFNLYVAAARDELTKGAAKIEKLDKDKVEERQKEADDAIAKAVEQIKPAMEVTDCKLS